MSNEKQITCELNGKKYLLFEVPVIQKNSSATERMIKKHKGILQGAKVHSSFWGASYVICKVLIPEENAEAFSNDSLDKN